MNDATCGLDQTATDHADEQALICEVSDEELEAAAGIAPDAPISFYFICA